MNGLLTKESLGKVKMIKGCVPMSKIINHLKNHKTKYIIGVLLIIVFSMSLYIFGNQDNKIEKLSKSVLMLNIYDTKNELLATGSGFIAFENDVLVTNYHVIDKAYKIEAIDENDVVYSLDKVIAFDKEKDLAILKFSNPTDLKVLKLHNSSKVSKGDEVIAIGSPLGLKNTVSKGIVSSIREDKETSIIQITAPISSGSSGGALLTEKGKVIGVTFAGIEDGQNLNLAIPANEIVALYNNKTNEQNVEEFFFEQNPIEKYKLECEKVDLSALLNNPLSYNGKDICVAGYLSAFSECAPYDYYEEGYRWYVGYLVDNVSDVSFNEREDFNRMWEGRSKVLKIDTTVVEYTDITIDNVVAGDYVLVSGNFSAYESVTGKIMISLKNVKTIELLK